MTKAKIYLRFLAAGAVILAAIALPIILSRQSGTTQGSGGVRVVAAENFWGNIASQIGAGHVRVTSIISDPSADPHLYESDARDASEVARADVVIVNGLGYDDFMSKLLAGSPSQARQVLDTAHILGVAGADVNPHLWYDLPRVPLVAAQIEQALAAKDPAHATDFAQGLAKFDQSLGEVSSVLAQIKQKYAGTPVAYTEPVPGYLLEAAGLDVKTPEGFARAIEDGNDPSPADAEAMQNLITTKRVKVLLYNGQATSPVTEHLRDLARAAGIPVIAVSETMPAGKSTYQSWQLDQARSLLNALGG